MRRILVNTYLTWHRRRSSTERPTEACSLPDSISADPADAVVAGDQTRRLLARLAPRARTILVLRYPTDLDDAAITELMSINASTVRATASRALAGLRVASQSDARQPAEEIR